MKLLKPNVLWIKLILLLTFAMAVNTVAAQVISFTGSPTARTTDYGTASAATTFSVSGTGITNGILVTAPAGFEVSIDGTNFNGTETVPGTGTITSTVSVRLTKTAAAGTYLNSNNNVVLSSAGATSRNVTVPTSTVNPLHVTIAFYADRPYGAVLNDVTLTASTFDFGPTNAFLKNGQTISTLHIAFSAGNTGIDPAGTYNNAIHPSNITGANGFSLANYDITYQAGPITIGPAPVVITANNVSKVYGDVVTGGAGSTAYTVTGLQNGQTINSVTTTYGNGATAIAAAGSYSGSIVQSDLVGGNGYLASNYTVTFVPGTLTVTPAPLLITAKDVTKIYGSLLTGSPGSTAYTVTGLKNGETVSTVTITYGSAAAAPASAGIYTGSVIPSAVTGGTVTPGNYAITYQAGTLTVTPAAITVTADNESKIYGDANPALTITYTGFVNSDGAGQLTTQPTAVTTATQASPVGQYPITVSGGVSSNYIFTYVNGVLKVNPPGITIPNTFTPNGDGINDTWNIINLNDYPKITVEIMNRYGTRIYFSNGYPVPWDGNYKGSGVPAGVYYYIITGVAARPMAGYITVLR